MTTADLTIRLATADESAAIARWAPYEVTVPRTRDLAAARRHLAARRSLPAASATPAGQMRLDLVAVPESGGAPLGFITLLLGGREPLAGEVVAYVADLQVHPDARRRGVASRLLRGAIALARREGAATLALDVADGNVAARRLYARAGFVTESRRLGLRLDGPPPGGGLAVIDGPAAEGDAGAPQPGSAAPPSGAAAVAAGLRGRARPRRHAAGAEPGPEGVRS